MYFFSPVIHCILNTSDETESVAQWSFILHSITSFNWIFLFSDTRRARGSEPELVKPVRRAPN